MTRDIVVTWPKTKPLADYLAELERALENGRVINYRVARLPKFPRGPRWGSPLGRCYMVHDGFLRGYCYVLYTRAREEGEVEGWPAGNYIVRSPAWHELTQPIPMRGFQGWRWMKWERA